MSVPRCIRDACITQFWDSLGVIIDSAIPDRALALKAGLTVARLGAANHEAPENWHGQLGEACDGCASYSKSFRRLRGRPLTVGDVIAYRDKDALVRITCEDGDTSSQYDLSELFGAGDLQIDASNTTLVWAKIDELCFAARVMHGKDPQHAPVPSRDEIAAEIKRHKRAKQTGMPEGGLDEARVQQVGAALGGLREARGTEGAPALDAAALAALDKDIAEVPAGGTKSIAELLAAGDVGPFLDTAAAKHLQIGAPGEGDAEAWASFTDTLNRAHGLYKMKASIPVGMMASIEASAASLAEQMAMGKAPTDVMSIGQDVISNCSAADLQALAANIPALVPDLKKVYEGMPDSQGAGMAGTVGALMNTLNTTMGGS